MLTDTELKHLRPRERSYKPTDREGMYVTVSPKGTIKLRNIYLSQQALDIMVALRTYAGGSRYVLPSRYDADRCMSKAALNRVTYKNQGDAFKNEPPSPGSSS